MLNALLAAAPALFTLVEECVAWVQASQVHTADEKAAVLAQLETRLAATLVRVQAARPSVPAP